MTRWVKRRAAGASLFAITASLGLTFGGGCSFGHGINVSGGRAVFAVTQYSIQ